MSSSSRFSVSPEQMTARARAYLIVGALRYLLIAAAMGFGRASYLLFEHPPSAGLSLFEIAPKWLWITSMVIGGLHLGYAAAVGSEWHARTSLVLSGALSIMWAMAFGLVAMDGAFSLLGMILFAALAAKDLIVCSRPMRSPFEPLVRFYAKERARGH